MRINTTKLLAKILFLFIIGIYCFLHNDFVGKDIFKAKIYDGKTVYHYNDTQFGRFEVNKVKLNFLKNFKNFCFLEQLQDVSTNKTIYHKNKYISVPTYDKKIWYTQKMEQVMWKTPQGVVIEDGACGEYKKCRIRCLPYYIVLGLAKSGTSDFGVRIQNHPMIFNTIMKEPFYWSHIRFLINATIGDYADFFDHGLSQYINNPMKDVNDQKYYPQISGELTSFTFTDDAWWMEQPGNEGQLEPIYTKVHDMYSVLPDAKLILILRNPTSRLYSSYNMYRGRYSNYGGVKPADGNPKDFHERVKKSIEWWHNCTVLKGLPRRRCVYGSPPEMPPLVADLGNRWMGKTNVANYSAALMKSMYVIFLKDWLSVYPREQLLLIKSEEYSANPFLCFNNIVFPYLGLEPLQTTESDKILNGNIVKQRTYDTMFPETKELLDKFYEPFNQELADFLDDDKWLWK